MGEETSESGQITRPIERTADRDDDGGSGGGGGDSGGGDLPPGTRAGEYVVEQRVGRGGMGTVYSARHPVLERRAAIKVMAADLIRDTAFVRRFVEEARAQSRIQHPNIAESFSFGQLDDGRCYYAMEWLDGETLSARLRRGPMALAEIIAVLDGVADALEAIHAGSLVHRDLTPGNLFLLRGRQGRIQVKVVDFGVAKQLGAGDLGLTASGMTLGTPTYAAPEQLAGEPVDGRADIYSLGVIGYQMATGELPFDAARVAALSRQKLDETAPLIAGRGGLPAGFERLIAAMLERAPARRPDLAAIRAGLAGSSTRRPRRLGLALGAALLAGAAAVAIALASGRSRRGDQTPTAAPVVEPAAMSPPHAVPAAVAGQESPPPAADAEPPTAVDAAPAPPISAAPPARPRPRPRPRPPATRRRPEKRPTARAPVEFVSPDEDPDYLLEPKRPRR